MDIYLIWDRFEITPTIFNAILITILLSIFFIICKTKIEKADPTKPTKGLMFLMELLVTGVEGFAKTTMGEKNTNYAPFIGTLIIFLAVANLFGLFGLTPPTSDYSVTLALALTTVMYIAISGIKRKGFGTYLKDTFLGDMPFLLPINIMGEITKPVSLSLRLFGNILSGTLIIAVLMGMMNWFSIILFPLLNAYFDIVAGLMQTLIFCMLTMIWLQSAVEIREPKPKKKKLKKQEA